MIIFLLMCKHTFFTRDTAIYAKHRKWHHELTKMKAIFACGIFHKYHFLIHFSTEHRLQDSVIIGHNQAYFGMLTDWLTPVVQINGQWILCWRASLHGRASKTFHSLCDNKGPTVTIVKDTNNSIFGGYTSIPWRE